MTGILVAVFSVLVGLLGGARVNAAEVAVAASGRPRIPRVVKFEGKPEVFQGKDGPWRPVKAGEVYQEMAKFRLGERDRLELMIQGERLLAFSGGSRFDFPGIRFETGETPQVNLDEGTVRWTSSKTESADARLTSALFDLAPPVGDFLFRVDPRRAEAEVLAVRGEITFQPLNSEESVRLTSMQRARFQGVLEEGEIAYDILLKGRKIPRGKLRPVESLTEAEMKPFLEEEKAIEKAKVEKRKALERRKAEDARVNRICTAPQGRLFECAWLCEGSRAKPEARCPLGRPGIRCVRKKCNANGDWAEATEVEGAEAQRHCQKVVQVGPCGG